MRVSRGTRSNASTSAMLRSGAKFPAGSMGIPMSRKQRRRRTIRDRRTRNPVSARASAARCRPRSPLPDLHEEVTMDVVRPVIGNGKAVAHFEIVFCEDDIVNRIPPLIILLRHEGDPSDLGNAAKEIFDLIFSHFHERADIDEDINAGIRKMFYLIGQEKCKT